MSITSAPTTGAREIDTSSIRQNPYNPRLFFNEESLDLLKTSIQEVGILVPLSVYADSRNPGEYVLLDGERRWRCALDLGFETVPVNVIQEPGHLDNILRMFNIHSVREDWPLISTALSLRDVIAISGESRETRLAELTGLTRGTVRRAKRILNLPEFEIQLMRQEAHLNRNDQVHREDLYLEIQAAESVLRNSFPEIAESYTSEEIIRNFASKRELGTLKAVTEFRNVSKIVDASSTGLVPRNQVVEAIRSLIQEPEVNPSTLLETLLESSYRQRTVFQKSRALLDDLSEIVSDNRLSDDLRESLVGLRDEIDRLLTGK